MKKLLSILVGFLFFFTAYNQDTTKVNAGSVKVLEEGERTTVTIGKNEIVRIIEDKDTTRIKLGKREMRVVETEDGEEIEWLDEEDEDEKESSRSDKKRKFKPHWAGFEWGINNYLNNDFQMSLPEGAGYMDLNTGRSWNFNLNFIEYGLGLGTDKVGLVTGLGLEWNNYHFDGPNNITENEDGIIQEYTLPSENASVQKTKLQTTYLTAPLLMEFQIPAGKKRIHLSGGVIGGVKIGSKTKMVYTLNSDKQKDKVKDDFNLASLRYGFTARMGYRSLRIYATYYPTALFESGKGPELYPFSIGLTLLNF